MAQDSSHPPNTNQFKPNNNSNKKTMNRDEIKSSNSNLQKEKLFQFPNNKSTAAPIVNLNENASLF